MWRCRNIFLTKKDVMKCLKYKHGKGLPEVKKLFGTYYFYYIIKKRKKCANVPVTLENVTHRKPFIVIEGSEASGSDVIARKVAHRIDGKLYENPPQCFCHLLEAFKLGLSKLRAAFKVFCNYAVAQEIAENIQKQPAVVDGYHYKHQAYHLARYALHKNNGTLPDERIVYEWPEDLLKPDVVYRIKTSEETIKRRLNISNIFRYGNATTNALIDEVYSRFTDTPIVNIDGNYMPKIILKSIVDHISRMFGETAT